ncbi:hypothetical protein XENOCAPTIV_006625, partial [Xenoophorus captivus]
RDVRPKSSSGTRKPAVLPPPPKRMTRPVSLSPQTAQPQNHGQGSSSGAPEGLDVPEEEDTVLLDVGLEIQEFQEQGHMFTSFRQVPSERCFAGVVRDPSPKRCCVSPTQSPKHNFPANVFALKAPSLGALTVFLSTTVVPNV